MNENIYVQFKANRQNHTVPARLALGWTRQRFELLDRMARLQFAGPSVTDNATKLAGNRTASTSGPW